MAQHSITSNGVDTAVLATTELKNPRCYGTEGHSPLVMALGG